MSLSLLVRGACCLPSLPERVCPAGSSQPAPSVASGASSPGPQGALFPAVASRAQLD